MVNLMLLQLKKLNIPYGNILTMGSNVSSSLYFNIFFAYFTPNLFSFYFYLHKRHHLSTRQPQHSVISLLNLSHQVSQILSVSLLESDFFLSFLMACLHNSRWSLKQPHNQSPILKKLAFTVIELKIKLMHKTFQKASTVKFKVLNNTLKKYFVIWSTLSF